MTSDSAEQTQPTEAQDPGRRRFLSFCAGAISTVVAGALGLPLIGMFLAPLFVERKKIWLPLGKVSDVKTGIPTRFTYSYVKMDGWFEKTVYGSAYVVLGEDGNRIVLSNLCTHLGCGVRWDPGRKAFLCPCHDGVFARDGRVLSGPPPKPLARFESRVAAGRIEILLQEV